MGPEEQDAIIKNQIEKLKQEIIDVYCEEDRYVTEYLYWRNVGDNWHLAESVWTFLNKA